MNELRDDALINLCSISKTLKIGTCLFVPKYEQIITQKTAFRPGVEKTVLNGLLSYA